MKIRLSKLNIGFGLLVFYFLIHTIDASSQSLDQLDQDYGFAPYILGSAPSAIKKIKLIDCSIRTGYHDKISCYYPGFKHIKNPWNLDSLYGHFTFFDEQLMLMDISISNQNGEEGFEAIAKRLIKQIGEPNATVLQTYGNIESVKAYGWVSSRVKVELRLELFETDTMGELLDTNLIIYSIPIFAQFEKSIR